MDFFRRSFWSGEKAEESKENEKEVASPDEVQAPPSAPPEGSMGSLLWSILSSKMGSDVFSSGISLPAWMYEPLTILQRSGEVMEHNYLLDEAAKLKDPLSRMAYIAAFGISAYATTHDLRTKTNFNPILGETFEFVDPKTGCKYFGEQVSHHPPISAFHATADKWLFWQNSSPLTKFLGNSLDVNTRGRSHAFFPDTKDHFFFTNPSTRVHNIILGTIWFEQYGDLSIKNHRTNDTCIVTFRKAGIFQGPQFKIEGYICNSKGKKCIKIEGKWNERVQAEWLVDTTDFSAGTKKELFVCPKNAWVPPYYMSKYAVAFNKMDEQMRAYLLPSDSRRRLDRLFLEKGDVETATHWKKVIEEKQRSDRKDREETWKPVWFSVTERTPVAAHGSTANGKIPVVLDEGDDAFKGMWVYTGDYWEQREKKIKMIESGEDSDEFLRPEQIRNTACDFIHYSADSSGESKPVDVPRTASVTTTTESQHSSPSESPLED